MAYFLPRTFHEVHPEMVCSIEQVPFCHNFWDQLSLFFVSGQTLVTMYRQKKLLMSFLRGVPELSYLSSLLDRFSSGSLLICSSQFFFLFLIADLAFQDLKPPTEIDLQAFCLLILLVYHINLVQNNKDDLKIFLRSCLNFFFSTCFCKILNFTSCSCRFSNILAFFLAQYFLLASLCSSRYIYFSASFFLALSSFLTN